MSLQAFNPPLGPLVQQCHPESVTLKMQEKLFSCTGDDFTINTTSGLETCKCKGKVLTWSSAKAFTDMQGHDLFALKNKHIALHKSFRAKNPEGQDLFTVKGKFSMLSSKSKVEFTNAADNRPVEMQVNGDWIDRSASITCEGQPVANISRSFFNMREILADKQTYYVTVAPNVDLTLIAALCVCLDEKENENGQYQ